MKTYIGIREPVTKIVSKGNIGTTWVETEKGEYRCVESGVTLPAKAIESDLKNGFLKLKED